VIILCIGFNVGRPNSEIFAVSVDPFVAEECEQNQEVAAITNVCPNRAATSLAVEPEPENSRCWAQNGQ